MRNYIIHSSSNVVRVIKFITYWWLAEVIRMEEGTSTFDILIGRFGRRQEDNMENRSLSYRCQHRELIRFGIGIIGKLLRMQNRTSRFHMSLN